MIYYDSMDAVMRRVFNTEPVAQLLDIGKLFQQSWSIVFILVCTMEIDILT
jgi:hypothetical protein